jgi:hypothetical protein
MTVDDLVDYLDVSLDEAEAILTSAAAIVEARIRKSSLKVRRRRVRRTREKKPLKRHLTTFR